MPPWNQDVWSWERVLRDWHDVASNRLVSNQRRVINCRWLGLVGVLPGGRGTIEWWHWSDWSPPQQGHCVPPCSVRRGAVEDWSPQPHPPIFEVFHAPDAR